MYKNQYFLITRGSYFSLLLFNNIISQYHFTMSFFFNFIIIKINHIHLKIGIRNNVIYAYTMYGVFLKHKISHATSFHNFWHIINHTKKSLLYSLYEHTTEELYVMWSFKNKYIQGGDSNRIMKIILHSLYRHNNSNIMI